MEAILFFNNWKRKGNQSVRKGFPFGLFITSDAATPPHSFIPHLRHKPVPQRLGDFYGINSKKVMTFAESNPKK